MKTEYFCALFIGAVQQYLFCLLIVLDEQMACHQKHFVDVSILRRQCLLILWVIDRCVTTVHLKSKEM